MLCHFLGSDYGMAETEENLCQQIKWNSEGLMGIAFGFNCVMEANGENTDSIYMEWLTIYLRNRVS